MSSAEMKMIRNGTYRRRVTWRNPTVNGVQGTPRDLTGRSATLVVRATPTSATPMFTLTSNPPAGLTLGGVTGTIDIRVTAAQTSTLTIGQTFHYALVVTLDADPTNERDIILIDKASVRGTALAVYP